MKRLEIRADAELDIVEATLWYEAEREGLGVEFSAELDRTVARITENPLQFAEKELGARMAMIDRFLMAFTSWTSLTP